MFADIHDTAIATLDLDPIKFKLLHPESGEGWTRERADAVELEYRRFLYLMKKFPNEVTAPLVDVDTFWHYHILDTMKYAADCERIFGYFLHHFPYYGMRGEKDFEALAIAGDRMQELYEQTFGETQFAGAQILPAYREAGMGTQAAYCIRSSEAAYCIKAAPSAYCIKAAASAYCIRAAETAYCIKGVDTEYSINTLARSGLQNMTRPAGVLGGARPPSAEAIAAYCIRQPAAMITPNLERPRLSTAG